MSRNVLIILYTIELLVGGITEEPPLRYLAFILDNEVFGFCIQAQLRGVPTVCLMTGLQFLSYYWHEMSSRNYHLFMAHLLFIVFASPFARKMRNIL